MCPGLIGLGDGVGLPESVRSTISTSYDVYDELGQLVGWIQNIEIGSTRTVTPVRHLSAADAGRIIEQVPAPELVTLRVVGLSLYNKESLTGRAPHYSLAARLSRGTGSAGGYQGKYLFKSLNSNKVPFNIKMTERHPAKPDTAVGVLYFLNCLLTGWTKPVNLGTVSVAETATIQVGQVDENTIGVAIEAGKVVGQ